jgi:hypothetical protein
MNRIQLVRRGFKTAGVAMILWGGVSMVYAKTEGCWAEFFQDNDYTGKHIQLDGPVQLESLRQINGESWDSIIDSLKVGPKARVTVFENINFKLTLKEIAKYPDLMRSLGVTEQDAKEDSELIFGPKATIHDLSDFNFHNKTRSLKIDCID